MISGNVKQIETMGLVDGPGIRVVIFLGGCSLRCLFCHNPEMWEKGEDNYTAIQLVNYILKYKNYFSSDGGVTFSGGEPLFQAPFLIECLRLCKENGINTCLDTSGSGDESYFDEVLKYTDLVIMDIKAIDTDNYKYITKCDIKNSLTFFEKCKEHKTKLWLRQVIIPGINDNIEYIKDLAYYIKKIGNVEKVELLPYHTLGVEKYKGLNIKYPLENISGMDTIKCSELEQELIKLINS